MKELPHPWDVYAALQAEEDGITKVGHRERAGDEKLNEFLIAVESGNLPSSKQILERQMKNLEINRQRKSRRRFDDSYDWAIEELTSFYLDSDIEYKYEVREKALQVRSLVTDRDWTVLWALASGYTYHDLHAAGGESEQVLQKRVSRARNYARHHLKSNIALKSNN